MIDKATLYHQPNDQYCYAITKESLHIRLRTKKNGVETAVLIYGDQYEWVNQEWLTQEAPLTKVGNDDVFDYWQIEVTPEYRRIRYSFKISDQDETIVFTEKGFFNEAPTDPSFYFSYPYLHTSEVFDAPDWVKDTIWYQIFPERFANGDSKLNPVNTKPWGSEEPTTTISFGGDFKGIMEHLDYLVDLGINGIYFTPIFTAKSNHKYDTIDYMEIDPQFGDKESFKQLVEMCHEKGIRVMLDAVFNHSGYYFPAFQDVLEKGEKSKYADWFHIHEFPLKGGDRPNYETFAFVESMPKLNTQHPDVKDYLLEVGRYWVKEFNIDGWRLDVANEVDHQFWREFRSAVKEIKPDLYILGEIWHDSMPWLRGDQFDAVMNYPFQTNILNLFAKETINPYEFQNKMTSVYYMYPSNCNEVAFNLVGSHDTPRIITECNGNLEKVKLIYALMLTYPGTPCIYYGDEIGMTGEMDPGCRKCMEWDEEKQNKNLFTHIQKLIQLRKEYPILANDGTIQFMNINEDAKHIAYTRNNAHQTVFVVLNNDDKVLDVELPFNLKGKKLTSLWNESEYAAESDQLSLKVEPNSLDILLFEV